MKCFIFHIFSSNFKLNIVNPSHVVCDLSRMRQYPPWLLFMTFVDSVGYLRYNLQKTIMQTMTHMRSAISLVVRVISRSKNNFYDVIRLKIIESGHFPKETVVFAKHRQT